MLHFFGQWNKANIYIIRENQILLSNPRLAKSHFKTPGIFDGTAGVKREQHLIEPGLYTIGKPTKESPIFVNANYTLHFAIILLVLKKLELMG
jgi:hypothetical protein